MDNITFIKKSFKVTVFILLGLTLLFGSIGTVGAGQRGVKTRFGAVTDAVYDEGLYFKIPFVERVVKMNVQVQKTESTAPAASKDLQTVNTVIALNYHLQPSSVARIYQEVSRDYEARVIAPAIQESVKSATAKFTAEELITKRSEVKEVIKTHLFERLQPYGIIVDEANIVNFQFSASFDQAIEAKVTAEQNALAAQNKLKQIEFEAQQKVAEARGKAEATTIEAQALRDNPQILELRALEKWNGVLPTVTSGAIPFINVD